MGNIHGVLNVETGYYVEDQEVEEEVKEGAEGEEKKDPDAMDTDNKDDGTKKTRKVKKQVRKGDLPISSGTASLDEQSKAALAEKKNELEAYIYDLRAKLDEQYAEFASEEEKTTIKAKLEATEDWLYDEGDDASKGVYIAKMDEIRAMAGPIVQRHFDKVEAERQRVEAEVAAKKAAEANGDAEMKDAEAPAPETEEAGDPK